MLIGIDYLLKDVRSMRKRVEELTPTAEMAGSESDDKLRDHARSPFEKTKVGTRGRG